MGGGFIHIFFSFSPVCGEMIQFDGRIFFQMGWFNHQLDGVEATIPVDGSEIGRKKPVEGKVVYLIMVQGFKNIPDFGTRQQ